MSNIVSPKATRMSVWTSCTTRPWHTGIYEWVHGIVGASFPKPHNSSLECGNQLIGLTSYQILVLPVTNSWNSSKEPVSIAAASWCSSKQWLSVHQILLLSRHHLLSITIHTIHPSIHHSFIHSPPITPSFINLPIHSPSIHLSTYFFISTLHLSFMHLPIILLLSLYYLPIIHPFILPFIHHPSICYSSIHRVLCYPQDKV